ncbi:hypothetical protein [Stenomitos frigidus]|uniref:Transposase n=1 Tax=Stenomitos frigidus AS-A4 TaxID=2933935 RepID=A0ABV0KQH9_9CYAN
MHLAIYRTHSVVAITQGILPVFIVDGIGKSKLAAKLVRQIEPSFVT